MLDHILFLTILIFIVFPICESSIVYPWFQVLFPNVNLLNTSSWFICSDIVWIIQKTLKTEPLYTESHIPVSSFWIHFTNFAPTVLRVFEATFIGYDIWYLSAYCLKTVSSIIMNQPRYLPTSFSKVIRSNAIQFVENSKFFISLIKHRPSDIMYLPNIAYDFDINKIYRTSETDPDENNERSILLVISSICWRVPLLSGIFRTLYFFFRFFVLEHRSFHNVMILLLRLFLLVDQVLTFLNVATSELMYYRQYLSETKKDTSAARQVEKNVLFYPFSVDFIRIILPTNS